MSPKLLNILLILIPSVLYFGYLNPMYTGNPGFVWTPESSIFILKVQNVQYIDALAQITDVQTAVNKIAGEYKNIDPATTTKITMMLPDSIDEVKLRNEVLTISNKSGVAISGLTVLEDPVVSQFPLLGSYIVSFYAKSHYQDLKKMIQNYEQNLRFYVIDAVNISRAEKKEGAVRSDIVDDPEMLNSVIKFRVYYLKK